MKTYRDVLGEGRPTALIPFFVLGDPDAETSLRLIRTAIDAGADVLELGIPFSDPIADGPTIQKAGIRSLGQGMNCARALSLIERIKSEADIPIGLLMYHNLIDHFGTERFFQHAAEVGVNSVLVADLSIDNADEVAQPARQAGLDTVFMVTPNTTSDRVARIAEKTTGFIYAVSLMGVTGVRNRLSDSVADLVHRIKAATTIPVCVGFGISEPEHAVTVANAGADGVIIGSRIVGMIEQNLGRPDRMISDIDRFMRRTRAALNSGTDAT